MRMRAALPAWLAAAERWALPAILLVAFALRLYRLGDKNVWWDEGLAIWAVRKGLLGVTRWTAQDVHPPLYFWSLLAWVRLAGESEFAARFLSALWGVLTVALVYPLGTRLGGRRVGLLAALYLAIARFHVWWSQEMRMYVLATLAATLTLYSAVRWLDEERQRFRPAWAAAYLVAALGCLYSIYLAGLAPLVANGYALVALWRVPRVRRWRVAGRWCAAQVAALALFAPWLLYALSRMHSWSVTQPFSARLLFILYSTLLTVGVSTEVGRYLLYVAPFVATTLAGLATLAWQRQREEPGLPGGQVALLLWGAVLSLPLVVYALTRPRHLFYTPRVEARYMLLFAPAFFALLAWSVVRLGRRAPALGLAALAACLGTMVAFLPGYYAGRYLRDEMQTTARILGTYARPGDVILLISGDRYPLFHYYYGRAVPLERQVPVIELPKSDCFTADNVAAELGAATAGRRRFWVAAVEMGIQDPQSLSLPWLDRHFRRALTHEAGYNALILYDDAATPLRAERSRLAPQRPLAVQGSGLELLGYDLAGHEYRANDPVDLGFYYVAQEPVQAEVQWRRDSGEPLATVTQDWAATTPAAARAAVRFAVAPWYRGGGTYFLLRWRPASGEGPQPSLRLPGPCILAAPGQPRADRIADPLDVTFAGGIRLRGFDLHRPLRSGIAQARPGEALTIDLYWEASEPVAADYTVFTHFVGTTANPRTGGPLWGQHDGPPVDGHYPTGTWLPGQMIVDRHLLQVERDAPAGEYELEIGLYLPATLERLRVAEPVGMAGADRVVVARVQVKP